MRRPALGVDVSDESVKFVGLEEKNGRLKVKVIGGKTIPAGAILAGRIIDRQVVVKVLSAIKKETGYRFVYASLPENEAYVVRLKLPPMKKSEIYSSIELQLDQHVPIPPEECAFGYEPLVCLTAKETRFENEVAVSVLPRQTADEYLAVFEEAGFFPLAFELEAQAIARALKGSSLGETEMIVDIGKLHTSFSIAQKGRVVFTSIIDMGGFHFTRALERTLKIETAEAEKIKTKKGLMRSSANQEIFNALIMVTSVLKDEVKRRLNYWLEHKSDLARAPVSEVKICGGQSTLPGLREYLESHLGLPVELGEPWQGVSFDRGELPPVIFNDAMRYATAIGLAERAYERDE